MSDDEPLDLGEAVEEAHPRFPGGTYELYFDIFHIPAELRDAPWIETDPNRQTLAEVREPSAASKAT